MDKSKLNDWAARFIGEDDDLVPDAVESEWYTKSAGAAFAVLAKSADMGHDILLDITDGEVEVRCGECLETGPVSDLAELITSACYGCHNG